MDAEDSVKWRDALTNQCTRIAMQRLIRIGGSAKLVLVLRVILPARNRVISSVSLAVEMTSILIRGSYAD